MIEKDARVVSVEGDRAVLSLRRQSACGTCRARKGCGSAALGSVFDRQDSVVALNPLKAQCGDEVVIGIDDSALVGSAAQMYLLPIVLMIGFAVLSSALLPLAGDAAAVPGALLGLAAGFILARRYGRARHAQLLPRIIRLAGSTDQPVRFSSKEDV